MQSTLATAVFGQSKSLSKTLSKPVLDTLLVLSGSLVIALLAQLEVKLPFTPVPLSGQTLGVLLIGATLGSRRGALSVLAYLAEGCLGLPVFSGGAAGIVHLVGPTGGYLVGFIPAAYFSGLMAERKMDRRVLSAFPAFIAAHSLIFLLGVSWLAFFVGRQNALAMGLYPFLLGEVIKTAIAAAALPGAWKLTQSLE